MVCCFVCVCTCGVVSLCVLCDVCVHVVVWCCVVLACCREHVVVLVVRVYVSVGCGVVCVWLLACGVVWCVCV